MGCSNPRAHEKASGTRSIFTAILSSVVKIPSRNRTFYIRTEEHRVASSWRPENYVQYRRRISSIWTIWKTLGKALSCLGLRVTKGGALKHARVIYKQAMTSCTCALRWATGQETKDEAGRQNGETIERITLESREGGRAVALPPSDYWWTNALALIPVRPFSHRT